MGSPLIVLLALEICFPDTEIVTSRSLRRTTRASCGSKNSNLMDIIEALSKEHYGRSYWKDSKGGTCKLAFPEGHSSLERSLPPTTILLDGFHSFPHFLSRMTSLRATTPF